MPTTKPNWAEYYENTKNYPPTPLLIKALEYVVEKKKAIDIGGGGLKDSRYLLAQGFDVTVIDMEPLLAEACKTVGSDQLHGYVTSFADFDFPNETYDLASAMFALPFNPPESFDIVLERIKRSLVPGGIFCGQFFGTRDQWSQNPAMTFHTKEQAERALADMEVISLNEVERDAATADGNPKHWHLFHFIARKK